MSEVISQYHGYIKETSDKKQSYEQFCKESLAHFIETHKCLPTKILVPLAYDANAVELCGMIIVRHKIICVRNCGFPLPIRVPVVYTEGREAL